MIKGETNRGFAIANGVDLYGAGYSLQKSSLATQDAIWLGIDDPTPKILIPGTGWVEYPIHEEVSINTRMHLSVEQVADLIPRLQKFVDTGEL